ncbi:MAG: efflux RND transporter periplasmic adaptor subunit [Acidobacteriota bacterium]
MSKPDVSALRIDPAARGSEPAGRRGWLVGGAAGLVLLALVAVGLGLRRPLEVMVAAAQPAGPAGSGAVLNASGYVTPRLRATVAAKITGRVREVLVDEGMPVEAGQVLARLDDADAQRRLAAAEAEAAVAQAALADLEVRLDNARREQVRALALLAEGVGTEQVADAARTLTDSLEAQILLARQRARSARAQVDIVRQDLENHTIRAPFAGIAVSKDAQPGEMVSPMSAGGSFTRTGISTIVDMTSLEIEVDVNESYIARVTPGQRVEATLDAYPDWRLPARVRTVIPSADRQKATVKVRISFDQLDPRILPDMGVKVAFLEPRAEGEEPAAARALVPRRSVRREGAAEVVYLLVGDVLERRAVRTGRERGDGVEILAGVTAGELVVTGAQGELKDGARARIKR